MRPRGGEQALDNGLGIVLQPDFAMVHAAVVDPCRQVDAHDGQCLRKEHVAGGIVEAVAADQSHHDRRISDGSPFPLPRHGCLTSRVVLVERSVV